MKLFALMLMTFLLASCGGGKSTATLSISRGMVLANTSFSGGIYITGVKTDGSQRFASAITTGNTANVSIAFGMWNLKVVGWDGGTMHTGTPYCKYLANFDFNTEGQSLEITTSTAECFATHDQISGTNQHVTSHSGPFRNLVVSTCGAHYNPSSTSDTIAWGYTDDCVTGGYPLEFQKKYAYFKLHLENEYIDGTRSPGITSSCLSAQLLTQTVKFPNRMPVTMKFYADNSCTTEVDSFRFKKGMDFALSEGRNVDLFDWSVTADTNNFFVYMPTGASKRSTTAFHSETPQFKCNDGTDKVPCPKLVSGAALTYYLDPDTYAVIKVPQPTCTGLTITLSHTLYSCEVFNGSAYIGLKANSTSPVSGTLSLNGGNYAITVGNANSGKAEDRVRDAYKTMKRVLGIRNSVFFDNSLQDDFDEGDNPAIGLLDSAIYDISSMGAGGTFFEYFNQCAVTGLTQVNKSYVKDGINYTVHLSGIALNTPGFISDSDHPEDIAPQLRLNRRLIVRKLLGGSYTTEKIIDLSCDIDITSDVTYTTTSAQTRTGRMEEQRSYISGLNTVTLKKLTFWNLSKSDKSRFDIYRYKRVASTSGDTPQKIEKNFYRAVKADGDENHFKIYGMNYEAVRDGSSYDESILVNEIDGIDTAGTLTYSHKRLTDYKVENTTVGEIFGTTFGQELDKIKYGFRPTQSEAEQTSIASSGEEFIEIRPSASSFNIRYTDAGSIVEPSSYNFQPDNLSTDVSDNGAQKIAVTNNSSTIYVYTLINNVWNATTIIPYSSQIITLKTKILNDGTYIVAWMEDETYDQVYWSINGGAVQSSPYTTYTHEKLALIKDSSFFYLSFVRTYSLSAYDQRYDMCYVNATTSCGFQQVASKNSTSHFSYHSAVISGGYVYHTYIHDGIVQTMSAASNVLYGGTQNNSAYVRKFNEYQIPFYSNLDETNLLRSTAGTAVDNYYRYYSPTISTFQFKPSSLKSSYFESLFTSGFGSLSN